MDRSFFATGFVVTALVLDGAKEAEARSRVSTHVWSSRFGVREGATLTWEIAATDR
jgi:hypothetical protein